MMGIIDKLFPDLIVSSIGWTLIHSIWQGLIFTIISVLLFRLLKKGSANARYLIGISMLVLMILVSLVTFVMVYQSGLDRDSMDASLKGNPAVGIQNRTGGFFTSLKSYLDRNLPAVVTIWLMGMMFFFLKFFSGILVNQRLRHHQIRDVSDYWEERVKVLSRKLKIGSKVIFRESFLTGIPLAIGYLKPMILFPVGLLSQIPLDQVEALIVHELSHIMRRDYIVNIFQNILDIIYFYHPGVRWISRQVRSEREHCCDDITVDLVGDSLNYARALTRVGEYSLKIKEDLAMAASRDSSKLLKRIRRLLSMKKDRSKSMEGFFGFLLTLVFVVSLVLVMNASFRLFAGTGKTGYVTGTSRVETSKEDVKRLMERHEILAARDPSSLTEAEQKEMQKIAGKLKALKKKQEKKNLQFLLEQIESLKAKNRRTEIENQKLKELNEFLRQYRLRVQYDDITEKFKELKTRESDLSKEEMKQLRLIEAKFKQQQEMELRRDRELESAERAAEEHELRLKEEQRAVTENEKQDQEEEKRLEERELRDLKREQELKKEYLQLEQEINRLEKKVKLSEEEKNLLQKLREKQEKIEQTIRKVHR
jgi:bla regulator protein BlaR1